MFRLESRLSRYLCHVTDQNGNKLTDESVTSYIEQSLGDAQFVRSKGFDGLTLLELTGTDMVGLTMAELHHSFIFLKGITLFNHTIIVQGSYNSEGDGEAPPPLGFILC
ncbi:hypothetical protein QQ045_031589 [Rhodiola kirilowii]